MLVGQVQRLLGEGDPLISNTTLDDVGGVVPGDGPQKVRGDIDDNVRHCDVW